MLRKRRKNHRPNYLLYMHMLEDGLSFNGIEKKFGVDDGKT